MKLYANTRDILATKFFLVSILVTITLANNVQKWAAECHCVLSLPTITLGIIQKIIKLQNQCCVRIIKKEAMLSSSSSSSSEQLS